MSLITIFFIFIIFLAFALLALNLLLAPHNPYQAKISVFECGYSSFLGQNRQQFSVSFFVFSLLFLVFDLEIILIYPYVLSAYNNSIYGLVVVIIFLAILTAGFVFELGKNALSISSRQSYSINGIYLASPDRSAKYGFNGSKKTLNLNLRFYSTKIPKYKENEFWKQISRSLREDSDGSFDDNPFIVTNSFLKKHPNLASDKKLAKKLINLDLINSILSKHIKNFDGGYAPEEEFYVLSKISPKRLELPIKDKDALVEIVGKSGSNVKIGVPGAYIFTNKKNHFSYVGSSIFLANRLSTGYLGPKRGSRKIDLAIKDAGLDSFYLDLYPLPKELVFSLENKVDKTCGKIKNLSLEQILILRFNPEYNVLKVAGSSLGYKHDDE
jgi:NADH-ubiquinone oxidoreductase chain 3